MTKENSKILITAAGGKVGQHVVTQLAQKRVRFRAGVHSQTRASALRESGIETAVLDFENSNSLAAGFKDVDTVFLFKPSGNRVTIWNKGASK